MIIKPQGPRNPSNHQQQINSFEPFHKNTGGVQEKAMEE